MAWLRNRKTGGWFEVPDDQIITKNESDKDTQIAKNKEAAETKNSTELPKRLHLPRVKAETANKTSDVLQLGTKKRFRFKPGTDIRGVYAFCGKGTSKVFRDAEKYAKRYGGDPKDWQHCAGSAIITNGKKTFKCEVHWVQLAGGPMREAFIKEREK